ncbi:MAG: hypothetical protein AABZ08_07360 [Planctomycetota bacterium]
MKFDADHARRVKRLWQDLKKEAGTVHLEPVEDPMDQLLEAVFSNYAAESRAHQAVAKIKAGVVDMNELRVTSVASIVEMVGADYPMGRAAAEELSRSLLSLYNRTHKLDLTFLMKQSRKGAETFLNRLDGIGPYAKASILQRCFKAALVPIDLHMLMFLRKGKFVPAEAPMEDTQKFLAQQVRESEVPAFSVLLKRHAAAHAPKKPLEYHPVTASPVAPEPVPVPAPVPIPKKDEATAKSVLALKAMAKKAGSKKAGTPKRGKAEASSRKK